MTGGSGYVGGFCLGHLVAARHDVTVLDRRPMIDVPAGAAVTSIVGDIADAVLVERVLGQRQIEAVLHLAAEKSVPDSLAAPGPHLHNSVCPVLFEAMRRQSVTKVVFSSSAAL